VVTSSPVYPISAATVICASIATLWLKLRRARDRRAIGADLEKRRCSMTAFRTLRGRTYDVEYTDQENDPARATATIARGGAVSWDEDFGDVNTSVRYAQDLPRYGQNWRG
jgi:hypothetical protein